MYLRGGGCYKHTQYSVYYYYYYYVYDVCDGVAIARSYFCTYALIYDIIVIILLCARTRCTQNIYYIVRENFYRGDKYLRRRRRGVVVVVRSAGRQQQQQHRQRRGGRFRSRTGSRINKLHVQVYPRVPSPAAITARSRVRGTCRRRRFRARTVGRAPALSPPPPPPPRSDRKSHPPPRRRRRCFNVLPTPQTLRRARTPPNERATAYYSRRIL